LTASWHRRRSVSLFMSSVGEDVNRLRSRLAASTTGNRDDLENAAAHPILQMPNVRWPGRNQRKNVQDEYSYRAGSDMPPGTRGRPGSLLRSQRSEACPRPLVRHFGRRDEFVTDEALSATHGSRRALSADSDRPWYALGIR